MLLELVLLSIFCEVKGYIIGEMEMFYVLISECSDII